MASVAGAFKLGQIPAGWLLSAQDELPACEIRSLCFYLPKHQRVAHDRVLAIGAAIDLPRYGRVLVPETERNQWLMAASALRMQQRILFGTYRIAGMWVIARFVKKRERVFAQQKIRVISREYFAAFRANPQTHLNKSVFLRQKTTFQKAATKKAFRAVRQLHLAQRARLAHHFQTRLSHYIKKSLAPLMVRIKETNALFFAPKEMTVGRIKTLTAEVTRAIEIAKQLDPALEALISASYPFIDEELKYADRRDPIHRLLLRKQDYDKRVKTLQTSNVQGQLASLQTFARQQQKRHHHQTRQAQQFLCDWIAGLSTSVRTNKFAVSSVVKTPNHTYLNIRAQYYADLVKFGKLIREIKWLSTGAAAAAVDTLQRHADEHYAPFLEQLATVQKLAAGDVNTYFDDVLATFNLRNKSNAFFYALNSVQVLRQLFLTHLDAYARAQCKTAWHAWQRLRLETYLRDGTATPSFRGSRPHVEAVQNVSKEFHRVTALFEHYLAVAMERAQDSRTYLHLRLRFTALRFYIDRANTLWNAMQTEVIQVKSVYGWYMTLRWLWNAAWAFYAEAAEDFLLRGDYYRPQTLYVPDREELARYSDYFVDTLSSNKLSDVDAYVERLRVTQPTTEQLCLALDAPSLVPDQDDVSARLIRLRQLQQGVDENLNGINKHARAFRFKTRFEWFKQQRETKHLMHRFARTMQHLINNIKIANRASKKRRLNHQLQIPVTALMMTLQTNLAVLNEYAWYAKFFARAKVRTDQNTKRTYEKFAARYAFGLRLRRANGKRILLYGNHQNLHPVDALRLYLAMHFAAHPGLIVYDGLPLNNVYETALVKGMLLGAQNDSRFAIVFTNEDDHLARDLAIKQLAVFTRKLNPYDA